MGVEGYAHSSRELGSLKNLQKLKDNLFLSLPGRYLGGLTQLGLMSWSESAKLDRGLPQSPRRRICKAEEFCLRYRPSFLDKTLLTRIEELSTILHVTSLVMIARNSEGVCIFCRKFAAYLDLEQASRFRDLLIYQLNA